MIRDPLCESILVKEKECLAVAGPISLYFLKRLTLDGSFSSQGMGQVVSKGLFHAFELCFSIFLRCLLQTKQIHGTLGVTLPFSTHDSLFPDLRFECRILFNRVLLGSHFQLFSVGTHARK